LYVCSRINSLDRTQSHEQNLSWKCRKQITVSSGQLLESTKAFLSETEQTMSSAERLQLSEEVTDASQSQAVIVRAFLTPFRVKRDYHRDKLGIDLFLNLHLRWIYILLEPFSKFPKKR
jgi:hypothetical protein